MQFAPFLMRYILEAKKIFDILGEMFPQAKAELDYCNPFELLIATVLSAQTTDIKVNQVTKKLFQSYPTPFDLSQANNTDVEEIIKTIGLYRTKAKNIITLSQILVERFAGEVPTSMENMLILPGVGRKTASVVLSEAYGIPAIAVDTHVLRTTNRLGLSTSDNPLVVEEQLKQQFAPQDWHMLHHRLIFFGRYFCKASPKDCDRCPFRSFCTYIAKQNA